MLDVGWIIHLCTLTAVHTPGGVLMVAVVSYRLEATCLRLDWLYQLTNCNWHHATEGFRHLSSHSCCLSVEAGRFFAWCACDWLLLLASGRVCVAVRWLFQSGLCVWQMRWADVAKLKPACCLCA